MARFASLFRSQSAAEQAINALKQSFHGEDLRTSLVESREWNANWKEKPEINAGHSSATHPADTELLDLWLDHETADNFAEGLKKGGAVLVVEVPDEYSRQAQKIIKDKNGKLG